MTYDLAVGNGSTFAARWTVKMGSPFHSFVTTVKTITHVTVVVNANAFQHRTPSILHTDSKTSRLETSIR